MCSGSYADMRVAEIMESRGVALLGSTLIQRRPTSAFDWLEFGPLSFAYFLLSCLSCPVVMFEHVRVVMFEHVRGSPLMKAMTLRNSHHPARPSEHAKKNKTNKKTTSQITQQSQSHGNMAHQRQEVHASKSQQHRCEPPTE